MRTNGRLTSWNEEKGFGFVAPVAGGKQIFIHVKAFRNRNRRPAVGQLVSYEPSFDKQGRPCAAKAALTGDRLPEETRGARGYLPIIGAVLFLVIVGITVLSTRLSVYILLLYMAASMLTFIMYALDKSAARNHAWRTQETTLHLLSLAGGWPGALIAQRTLRHKTRKRSLLVVFWVTVLLNCGAFVWLCMPNRSATLHALIGNIV